MPKRKKRAVDIADKPETMATIEIAIGARVHCTDGIGGRVTHVITTSASQQVTDVVVREERWPCIKRLVPIKWLAEAADGVIRLRCTRDELARMEPFVEIGEHRKKFLPYEQANGRISTVTPFHHIDHKDEIAAPPQSGRTAASHRKMGTRPRHVPPSS